jgi:hypothetical protein
VTRHKHQIFVGKRPCRSSDPTNKKKSTVDRRSRFNRSPNSDGSSRTTQGKTTMQSLGIKKGCPYPLKGSSAWDTQNRSYGRSCMMEIYGIALCLTPNGRHSPLLSRWHWMHMGPYSDDSLTTAGLQSQKHVTICGTPESNITSTIMK